MNGLLRARIPLIMGCHVSLALLGLLLLGAPVAGDEQGAPESGTPADRPEEERDAEPEDRREAPTMVSVQVVRVPAPSKDSAPPPSEALMARADEAPESPPEPPRASPPPREEAPAPAQALAAPPRPSPSPAPSPSLSPRLAMLDTGGGEGFTRQVCLSTRPRELESHLERSRGCLVVAMKQGGVADVHAYFDLVNGRMEARAEPCAGIAMEVLDQGFIRSIGDPFTRLPAARGPAPGVNRPCLLVVLNPGRLERATDAALAQLFPGADAATRARAARHHRLTLSCWTRPDGDFICGRASRCTSS